MRQSTPARGPMHGAALADNRLAVLRRQGQRGAGSHADATRGAGSRFDLQHVRAERGNPLTESNSASLPELNHRDDGPDADDDAQTRQRRAKEVPPQGTRAARRTTPSPRSDEIVDSCGTRGGGAGNVGSAGVASVSCSVAIGGRASI